LLALRRMPEAIAACRDAIVLDPHAAESHYNLGNALRDNGQLEEAAAAYRQAAALQPTQPEALIALGDVLLPLGRGDEAQELFRQAYRLRPLSRRPAIKQPPDFSALFLVAPGSANTPSDYLIGGAGYDSHFLAVMDGVDYDPHTLRRCADVVVNLISDADLN